MVRILSNYRTKNLTHSAEMFGALANPHRLKLMLRIVDCCGPTQSCSRGGGMGACVQELSEGLNIAKSTVSHHLKELRRAGLIDMRRQGRFVECKVNASAISNLSELLSAGLCVQANSLRSKPSSRKKK